MEVKNSHKSLSTYRSMELEKSPGKLKSMTPSFNASSRDIMLVSQMLYERESSDMMSITVDTPSTEESLIEIVSRQKLSPCDESSHFCSSEPDDVSFAPSGLMDELSPSSDG